MELLRNVDDRDARTKGKAHCGRCAGTGQYVTAMVNGKLRGPGGICFRCRGKGWHDEGDRRRNLYYDERAAARES